MKQLIMLLVAAPLSFYTHASSVTWTSGTIYLPNGQKAGEGDVVGYLFSTADRNYIHLASFYDLIHEGIDTKTVFTKVYDERLGREREVGAFVTTGMSDRNGQIDLTEVGLVTGGEYNNQWAKVYYICIQDGYEYYKEINGDHYETSPEHLLYQNLASYGTWKQGYAVPEAIPEPTSALLILLGTAFVCLRRSQRRSRIRRNTFRFASSSRV